MWSVARRVLREAGRESDTADVVQEAMRSLIASPPKSVMNWEALMVATAKRRALDLLDSARVRHDGGELSEEKTEAPRERRVPGRGCGQRRRQPAGRRTAVGCAW